MKKILVGFAAFAWAVLLSGCGGSSGGPVVDEKADPGSVTGIEGKAEDSLAELLTKPRAELAKHASEEAERLQLQENSRREGKVQFPLLPDLRLPLSVPVWRDVR